MARRDTTDGVTHVALLRAVNVGGRRPVAMADLRGLLAPLGFTGIRTYLQSGNAVFTAPAAPTAELAARIEDALQVRFGFEVPVLVLTAAELARVVAGNPYPDLECEPTRLVVAFLGAPVPPGLAADFELTGHPERGQIGERVLYLYYPNGQGATRLTPAVLQRRIGGIWSTARNWRTVRALAELAGDEHP